MKKLNDKIKQIVPDAVQFNQTLLKQTAWNLPTIDQGGGGGGGGKEPTSYNKGQTINWGYEVTTANSKVKNKPRVIWVQNKSALV